MDCKKAQALLSTYLDKKLAEKDKDFLELHLRDCDNCRLFLANLEETVNLVSNLEEVEPPANLLADIEKEIQQIPPKKSFFTGPIWMRVPVEILATTAVLVLVFVATRSIMMEQFSQPADDLQSRWQAENKTAVAPQETAVPSAPETPAPSVETAVPAEESKEIYDNVVSKVRSAYKDMGVSPSQVTEDKMLQGQTAGEAEGKLKKAGTYAGEEPKAWEKEVIAPTVVPGKTEAFNKAGQIAGEYNINVELADLSRGVDELTTQVHNYNGSFIEQQPAVQTKEKATHKEMNFRIPRANYYQFIWNIEQVGTIKKIAPVTTGRLSESDFVTVHLSIDLISTKK